ncbi:MAG: 3-phosphoshikimate 1-carboxyvinyltransferase, partial [Candidatus Dadabacteria bacterium]|nr:3-phosphoshikimate 1-carboxyvinyltransferase [Candidatus Dadabacteria bacterium]
MSDFILKEKTRTLAGEITPPGDKSISHRAVILGSLGRGKTKASGFLASQDTLATANAFRSMGIEVEVGAGGVEIAGRGLFGLKEPRKTIDAENSGTTARLLTGVLSAQSFPSTITGDDSLRRRPMSRVTVPLRSMGARISGEGEVLPLHITGSELQGIDY